MKKLLLVAFLPLTLFSQTYDVLFLGNSYTASNILPMMISEIALSFGDTINYDSNTPGGFTLQSHATNPNSLSKISQQNWDFVVIQAQSQEPSFPPSQVASQTYPYAQILIDSIASNNSCTEPVFFMTWGRKNGDAANAANYPILGTYLGMQWRLRQSYIEMGNLHEATVSPVGMSWKNSIQTNPSFDLYTVDESHPNIAGSYLAACTFYSTLFNKSCLGSSYFPASLSYSDATYLQNVASSTVLDSTFIWNMFDIQSIYAAGDISFDFFSETSNADSIYWDFGDGSVSTDENPTYTYLNFGVEYDVVFKAFSNGGCRILTDTIQIYTQIPESVGNLEGISVYPIPVNDYLFLDYPNLISASIYTIKGQKILDIENDQIIDPIDLKELTKGVYILNIQRTDSHNQQIKILKQ